MIIPIQKLLRLVLVLKVGHNGVPDKINHTHEEHPELGGHKDEVDHLEGGAEKPVTDVQMEELVLEPYPCLGRSLGLHDGDAIEEGGV